MGKARIVRPDFGGAFPAHIAIIMDGNGRWAERRGLQRILGHREGIASVREITTECARMGVESLTLYAFSAENWKRPALEVRTLMQLLRLFLSKERATLMDNDVRLSAIGRLDQLPKSALAELRRTEELTRRNGGMLLRLALSYGSRSEIADALKRVIEDARAGRIAEAEVDEETLRRYLYDPATPDPDLVIRTAGELRLSNFLLWQASYSELFVSPVCWPEFRKNELHEALRAYASRKRKFGGLEQDPQDAGERARSSRRRA